MALPDGRGTGGSTARRTQSARRRWVGLLVALALVTACSKERRTAGAEPHPEGFETLEIGYQASPGTVPPIELAEDLGFLAPLKLRFVSSTVSGPQSIQAVVTGDTDVGSAFNGAILKLIAAKAPIQAVVGSYGVDDITWSGFYVKEDSSIRSARDLLGKKVSMNTLGAHSEFMLREYLLRAGLSRAEAKQVTLLVVPPVNGEQALRQGQVDVASLGGIFRDRALERGGLRLLFSDFQLYGSFTAGSYVLNTEFMRRNPNSAKKLVSAVAQAIEWSQRTPRDDVVARFRRILSQRKRAEDTSVIQYWQSYGIAGRGGQLAEREFRVWLDWMVKDEQLAPAQLAVSDVYTNQLNPYAAATEAVRP